jgi:GT2 family glycosyltransferase
MSRLRVGFVEPHLGQFGGIRRVVEFGNRLVARGHEVTFFVPDGQALECSWMPCTGRIAPISDGLTAPLDVVVFNHEPQWHLVERFSGASRRIFYALHYGRLYNKEGSWEALRFPVDLQLANSNWTAEQIEAEIGHRPTVLLGGVNRDNFRPWGGPKRHSVLCSGIDKWWKGTDTIREAGRLLGLPVEGYAGLGLDQMALGREYDAALVFAVGSWFEGFCQPGLEALACGVPLVTTDNGGCREYALDEQTALVVPPRDAPAMAAAIERLLEDDTLAKQLAANGLDLVEEHFDWEARTDQFAEILDGVVAGAASPPPAPPAAPVEPTLSVVVLTWDNLLLTQRFVETVRQRTDVDYELIIVDNGSQWEAANYAELAADTAVLNETNLGFAKGMNQGLEAARGTWVAFCNNDTQVPEQWASKLLETAAAHPTAGIIVPAVTAANNSVTVRDEPGDTIEVLAPFSPPPAAVMYLARAEVITELGAWGEEYEIASGEDVDLAFKVWVNDLDIVYDSRVLVDHISKGTATRLDDWRDLWARNRARFLEKWASDQPIPRLATCDPDRHRRNRATARSVADWMNKYFTLRDNRTDDTTRSHGLEETEPDILDGQFVDDGSPAMPVVMRRPEDGRVFLVEGKVARPVRSGLLAAALTEKLGEHRSPSADELRQMIESDPVEVLTSRDRPPWMVVANERMVIDGLPIPRRLDAADPRLALPTGPTIDVARANVAACTLVSAQHTTNHRRDHAARRKQPAPPSRRRAVQHQLNRALRAMRRRIAG